ncbi:MAG: hypothetical protein F6K09_32010, partial [Merismopedia sp. SIO2A8]|nr:hypothetical protein [Merismopedia sp. SIO2A8]
MDLDVNSPPSAIGYQAPSSQEVKGGTSEFDALLKRGLNFWPLVRTVKRKALLITGVTVLLTGFSAFQTSQAPPLYQGNFELLVEPITTQGQLADPTALARGVNTAQKTDYATQLRILRSTRLLREIVETVRSQSPAYADFRIKNLERSLRVGRLGETRLSQTKIILVSYENDDPDVVDRVLKATADRYLQYSLED